MAEIARINSLDFVPHEVECEQQVLGALLLDTTGVATIEAAGGADLFHDPVHGEIYAKIRAADRDGMMVSTVTLSEWARQNERMSDLGGPAY